MKNKIVLFSPLVFWIVVVAGSLAWNINYVNESITIPAESYLRTVEMSRNSLIAIHVSVLFLGMGGFFLVKNYR